MVRPYGDLPGSYESGASSPGRRRNHMFANVILWSMVRGQNAWAQLRDEEQPKSTRR